MVCLPVLASLRRISLVLHEHRGFGWLGWALSHVVPKDMSWGSVYVQNGTLWIGFLGAILAAAGGKHLGLATTNFMPRGKLRDVCETFTTTVVAIVSLVLAYASARMVSADRLSGDSDLLPGGIPGWYAELIMPVGFAVIAARTVWRATDPVARYSGPHGVGQLGLPHPGDATDAAAAGGAPWAGRRNRSAGDGGAVHGVQLRPLGAGAGRDRPPRPLETDGAGGGSGRYRRGLFSSRLPRCSSSWPGWR